MSGKNVELGVNCIHFDGVKRCNKLTQYLWNKRICTLWLSPAYKCNVQKKKPEHEPWVSKKLPYVTDKTPVVEKVVQPQPKPFLFQVGQQALDMKPKSKYCPSCKHVPKDEDTE